MDRFPVQEELIMHRFFADPERCSEDHVTLFPEDARHAVTVLRLKPEALRLDFTVESGAETKDILSRFLKVYRDGIPQEEPFMQYTKGHFRRGVE